MKLRLFINRHTQTQFIKLDTGKCKACWKCIESCNKKVIGKIDFLGHRHAKINNADKCAGCLKCLKVCIYGAYTKNDEQYKENSI
jgi:2-oxoglutarate ferredoxin oxidoreductase subunit delta